MGRSYPPNPVAPRALAAVGRKSGQTGGWHGSAVPPSAVQLDHPAKAGERRGPRPDGGVVTQRTANPCTPVRFRLGPPPIFRDLSLCFDCRKAALPRLSRPQSVCIDAPTSSDAVESQPQSLRRNSRARSQRHPSASANQCVCFRPKADISVVSAFSPLRTKRKAARRRTAFAFR
jgi:hypothetical protein